MSFIKAKSTCWTLPFVSFCLVGLSLPFNVGCLPANDGDSAATGGADDHRPVNDRTRNGVEQWQDVPDVVDDSTVSTTTTPDTTEQPSDTTQQPSDTTQ